MTDLNVELLNACKSNDLDAVKVLISKGVDSSFNESEAFQSACTHYHWDIANYLLTVRDNPADIHTNDSWALCNAFKHGNENQIKFLLSSTQIKECANEELALKLAIRCDNFSIVDFLLIEKNIKISDGFKYWLNSQYDASGCPKEKVFQLLRLREFSDKIQLHKEKFLQRAMALR